MMRCSVNGGWFVKWEEDRSRTIWERSSWSAESRMRGCVLVFAPGIAAEAESSFSIPFSGGDETRPLIPERARSMLSSRLRDAEYRATSSTSSSSSIGNLVGVAIDVVLISRSSEKCDSSCSVS